MGIVAGDIDIEVEDEVLPFMVERCITICGKKYCVYKKEEAFAPGTRNRIRYIIYLKEVP